VFCSRGGDFKNEIIWRRTGAHSPSRSFGPIHDVIFFYTKSTNYTFNIIKRPYMNGHVESRYDKDETGKLKFNTGGNILTGSGRTGSDSDSGKKWRGFDPTSKNRHWAVPGYLAEQMPDGFENLPLLKKLDALYEAGLIDITEGNAWPVPVKYLSKSDGNPISDIWAAQPYTEGTVYGTKGVIDADVQWLGTTAPERLGYPTQKPTGLMERIIKACTNRGDVVLDAYCGCGTTVVAAENLERSWIGIDITYQSIALIIKRFEDAYGKEIADSIKLSGIPQDMAGAEALAHKKDDRLRKEFEKWAILTYSNNWAVINEKYGSDGGIDGIVHFRTDIKENGRAILQVKSGHVGAELIRSLFGTIETEKAQVGFFITLEEPTGPMRKAAKEAGTYDDKIMGRKRDRITLVTIKEIIEDQKRIDLPTGISALKSAAKADEGKQEELL